MIIKRWSENAAMKATNTRFRKIDDLLQEIACLWGDEDQFIVNEAEELRRHVEKTKLDCIISAQERAEIREEAE